MAMLPTRLAAMAWSSRAMPLNLTSLKVRSSLSGIDRVKPPFGGAAEKIGLEPHGLQIAERLRVEKLEHGRRRALALKEIDAFLRVGAEVGDVEAAVAERDLLP